MARCVHASLFIAGGTRGDAEAVVVFPRPKDVGVPRCLPYRSPGQPLEGCWLRSKGLCLSAPCSTRNARPANFALRGPAGGYWVLSVRGDEARHLRPDETSIASALHRRLFLGRLCRPQVGGLASIFPRGRCPIAIVDHSEPQPQQRLFTGSVARML